MTKRRAGSRRADRRTKLYARPRARPLDRLVRRLVDDILLMLRNATADEVAELRCWEDEPAQEITDPAALLEACTRSCAATSPQRAVSSVVSSVHLREETVHLREESGLVATTSRRAAGPPLREGEAIVRAGDAGVVIRRRKPTVTLAAASPPTADPQTPAA